MTETWLTDSVPHEIVNISGLNIVRRDRLCGRGGGVAIYRVYQKKLNKPEIAHRLCKAPQCTKFFIEIGCLGTDNVV